MTSPICPTCRGTWSRRHRCITGADLAKARGAVTQTAVAAAWGRSKAYVGQVEKMLVPTATTAADYRAALVTAKETGE